MEVRRVFGFAPYFPLTKQVVCICLLRLAARVDLQYIQSSSVVEDEPGVRFCVVVGTRETPLDGWTCAKFVVRELACWSQ